MLLSSTSLRRWGWVSFWIQLALSLVSAVILLFSVAFTSANGPRISLYMTVFGIMASFFSTFWSYGYTRLSQKLQRYADATEGSDVQSKAIKKKDVKRTLRNGLTVNVVGMGAALLGLQAMVGMLVAKTLTSASANPFFQGTASSQFNPVLALDVFLVQAATNTILSHFVSLVLCFLLLRAVDQ